MPRPRSLLCPVCNERPKRPTHAYCNECHAANMRATRPRHSELSDEARSRANARSYAHVYRDRGELQRKPCAECGSEKSEMHHPDHRSPLCVVWLCRKCHLDAHNSAR